MEEINELSEMEFDALREIGNIGAGNAATALSQLLNRKIDMAVPEVKVLPLEEVAECMGGEESIVAGIFLRVFGNAPCSVMFLLPRKSALNLVDMLLGKANGTTKILNDLDQSALKEIGNILSASYLNALSQMTNLTLLPSVPALAFDMLGAILSVLLAELGEVGDYALVMETEFTEESQEVKGHFFLIPDPGTLEVILRTIGVRN
ncbi:MAG: chemotaxis protein CheC [bacterium]